MTNSTSFLITRHRAYIAPEDCRAVALLVGSGLSLRDDDFTHQGAALDMLGKTLLRSSMEEWSRPLLCDLLKYSAPREALDVFAASPRGAVIEYMTIANLKTRTQGEFISYSGGFSGRFSAHAITGGLLVCGDDTSFARIDGSLGLYNSYAPDPNQKPPTARELLYPLSSALDEYENLGAIYWDAIFTPSNPNITIHDSPQDVVVRKDTLDPYTLAPVVEYPLDHEVWTTPARAFGTDIHFDMLAETIQTTGAIVEVHGD